jgi:hypothetical protein
MQCGRPSLLANIGLLLVVTISSAGEHKAGAWRLLEGVSHENLTVFPIVLNEWADTGAFVTLDEALTSGEVIVTEQGSPVLRRSRDGRPLEGVDDARVDRLVLVNRGPGTPGRRGSIGRQAGSRGGEGPCRPRGRAFAPRRLLRGARTLGADQLELLGLEVDASPQCARAGRRREKAGRGVGDGARGNHLKQRVGRARRRHSRRVSPVISGGFGAHAG